MRSTYPPEDVEILLKDITGLVEPLPSEIREKKIQSGTHYCEMLPLEYRPTEKYMAAYHHALANYGSRTAKAIGVLAEKIYRAKGNNITLVSLARAGIPVGILLRRYLCKKYPVDIKHYAISIIRGRGIDQNALRYIISNRDVKGIQFVDGWTGKGAILGQLELALKEYGEVDKTLGVIADPANITTLCGTHEDILIPSSCLNATITGLISRTFLRDDIIGPEDFHGAAFYENLKSEDLSLEYLGEIESKFRFDTDSESLGDDSLSSVKSGPEIVKDIAEYYRIADINFIKPGIGEATRVLLRRIPWKVIVAPDYFDSGELNLIRQLCLEKNICFEISRVDLGNYKVCGLIKNLSDV